jgi:hypothetical protein
MKQIAVNNAEYIIVLICSAELVYWQEKNSLMPKVKK